MLLTTTVLRLLCNCIANTLSEAVPGTQADIQTHVFSLGLSSIFWLYPSCQHPYVYIFQVCNNTVNSFRGMKSPTNNPHHAAKAIKPQLQPLVYKHQMWCQVIFHLMNKVNYKRKELAKNKIEKLKNIFCMIEKNAFLFLSTFSLTSKENKSAFRSGQDVKNNTKREC